MLHGKAIHDHMHMCNNMITFHLATTHGALCSVAFTVICLQGSGCLPSYADQEYGSPPATPCSVAVTAAGCSDLLRLLTHAALFQGALL